MPPPCSPRLAWGASSADEPAPAKQPKPGKAVRGKVERDRSRSVLRLPTHLAKGGARMAGSVTAPIRRLSLKMTGRSSQSDGEKSLPAGPSFTLNDLTEGQRKEVELAFTRFDRDESGKIGVGEMRSVSSPAERAPGECPPALAADPLTTAIAQPSRKRPPLVRHTPLTPGIPFGRPSS